MSRENIVISITEEFSIFDYDSHDESLRKLHQKVNKIMADLTALNAAVADLTSEEHEAATELATLAAQVSTLTVGEISQATIDGLAASVTSVATALRSDVSSAQTTATEPPPAAVPPVDQPPVDQPPVDQPPVDQPPVDQPPVDQPPVDQPPVDQPPAVGPTYYSVNPAPADSSVFVLAPVTDSAGGALYTLNDGAELPTDGSAVVFTGQTVAQAPPASAPNTVI